MEQLQTSIVNYQNGIYGIDQEMVRAFLIVGEQKALLLDTGAARTDIMSYIKAITSLPLEVALTHADGDHLGNLPAFSQASVHGNDVRAVLNHESCREVKLSPLTEGQVFDLGGRKLQVLHTPGHTAGSICLLDAANRILFSGDTASYGPVYMFGARRDMPGYLASLHRLRQMKEDGVFTTIYCCHNTCPIPADTVDDLIACVNGILDKSISAAPAPMPFPGGERPLLGKYGNCSILFD